jgi:hypothetical protein
VPTLRALPTCRAMVFLWIMLSTQRLTKPFFQEEWSFIYHYRTFSPFFIDVVCTSQSTGGSSDRARKVTRLTTHGSRSVSASRYEGLVLQNTLRLFRYDMLIWLKLIMLILY